MPKLEKHVHYPRAALASYGCARFYSLIGDSEGTHCVYEVGLALLTDVKNEQDLSLLVDNIRSLTVSVWATTATRSKSKVRWVGFEPSVVFAQGWTDTRHFSGLGIFSSGISLMNPSNAYLALNHLPDAEWS
jgi:hypothetical protein